jgi:cytochrome c-type biogenesis protein CcmF
VLFTGIGPLVAWGRFTSAAAKRVFLWPTLGTAVALAVLLAFTNAETHIWALLLFVLAAFTFVALAQEFWRAGSARKALVGGNQFSAMAKTIGRNRRRYGGYTVHLGIAVLLIGIAASSSFQHNQDLRLQVGDTANVGGYTVKYVAPTSSTGKDYVGFGAILDVTKDGKEVATLAPQRRYFASTSTNLPNHPIASLFNGEATSEVGLKAGARRDIWTAFQPDLNSLMPRINEADRKFAKLGPDVQGLLVRAIMQSYVNNPPPATFRVIVDPLVTWLWIGAIIAILGALISVWPSGPSRRRVSAAAVSRLGRTLSRA